MNVDPKAILHEVKKLQPLAEKIFTDLAKCSKGPPGITRDTYGDGETRAHELFCRVAETLDFEVSKDFAANSYATVPGYDRDLPRIVVGSHLDSVRKGGNFDGAAGVVAGLVSSAAIVAAGLRPACDISTMAVRAEESAWFQISYIGSRSALGNLPDGALEAPRVDTGKPLAQHIIESGGDPRAIELRQRAREVSRVKAYLELHIEQAPSLVEAGLPLAICTGIPGNFRYRNIRISGEHGHVGLPRRFRRDAVMAAVDFASRLDALWAEFDSIGRPMACTLGRFHTDPEYHGLTNVPGLFHLSLDVRAYDEAHLQEAESRILEIMKDVERQRGVKFETGKRASAAVAKADSAIFAQLQQYTSELSIDSMSLGSPGSHDAAAFSEAGVPFGMVLIRNANGSHNPDESMEMRDFIAGTSVLALWLARHAMDSGTHLYGSARQTAA